MKTRFSSKVIMFEKVLEFIEAIFLCYRLQKIIILQQTAPKDEVLAIVEALTFFFESCCHCLCDEPITRASTTI
jgi:hypothetical protein